MKALLLALAALSAGSAVAGPADTLAVGSDIAEIVERLGASERLLGRDDSSAYPADIARLPSIGYMRQLSAEAVLSLHPRRLLVSDAARPAIVLRQLRAVGLDVVEVPRGRTVEAIPRRSRWWRGRWAWRPPPNRCWSVSARRSPRYGGRRRCRESARCSSSIMRG